MGPEDPLKDRARAEEKLLASLEASTWLQMCHEIHVVSAVQGLAKRRIRGKQPASNTRPRTDLLSKYSVTSAEHWDMDFFALPCLPSGLHNFGSQWDIGGKNQSTSKDFPKGY